MNAPFDYFELLLRLLPETILVLGALTVLFAGKSSGNSAVLLGLATCGTAVAALALQGNFAGSFEGMLVTTPFTRITKICLLVLSAAAIGAGLPSKFSAHGGEYIALILLGSVGLTLLVSAEELLMAFISLEIASLSLYLLAGFDKQSGASAEAAMKYFLFGSVSAAFTLFGISLIYGLAGGTTFTRISAALAGQQLSPLMIAALVFTAIGFAFKIAAAPLHLWAPDAYQGAPAQSAALIASGSKLGSMVLFAKLFIGALGGQAGSASFGAPQAGWMLALAVLATVSILLGNLLAIGQANFRRLMAYSAVAHAGYALIAVLAGSERGISSAVFYMFTYGLSVAGIFAIVGQVERVNGAISIQDFRGLSRGSPLLALALFVFILSLAGIPPLAGFFGKFYVFVAALDASRSAGAPGLLWVVILAIGASAVSLYYYIQVLKQAWVAEGEPPAPAAADRIPRVTIVLLALAVILFGCFPNLLVGPLERSLPGAAAGLPPGHAYPASAVVSAAIE